MVLDRVNVKTKKQALFSFALLRSGRFRRSRMKTRQGRKLFNEEIDLVKSRLRQFKVNVKKPFPRKVRV